MPHRTVRRGYRSRVKFNRSNFQVILCPGPKSCQIAAASTPQHTTHMPPRATPPLLANQSTPGGKRGLGTGCLPGGFAASPWPLGLCCPAGRYAEFSLVRPDIAAPPPPCSLISMHVALGDLRVCARPPRPLNHRCGHTPRRLSVRAGPAGRRAQAHWGLLLTAPGDPLGAPSARIWGPLGRNIAGRHAALAPRISASATCHARGMCGPQHALRCVCAGVRGVAGASLAAAAQCVLFPPLAHPVRLVSRLWR